jgi:hypothetical protein
MTKTEIKMWKEAELIAVMAMGKEPPRQGRSHTRRPRDWNANNDPLAHWLLTESIVEFAKRHGRTALTRSDRE